MKQTSMELRIAVAGAGERRDAAVGEGVEVRAALGQQQGRGVLAGADRPQQGGHAVVVAGVQQLRVRPQQIHAKVLQPALCRHVQRGRPLFRRRRDPHPLPQHSLELCLVSFSHCCKKLSAAHLPALVLLLFWVSLSFSLSRKDWIPH